MEKESFIKKNIEVSKNSINDYLIIMVANVKELTATTHDYNGTSIISEYYSLQQFEEISTTIKSLGFELKCYFDEDDFISDYENKIIRNNYPKKFIVLNSAQKGISPGRKSLIPAFCALHNILYSNSNAYVTSFIRNKYHWNSFLGKGNAPICESWVYDYKNGWGFNLSPPNGEKVICKLNSESSSIGLTQDNIFNYCFDKEEFIKDLSKKFKQKIIIQKFISGREIEVPVISTPNKTVSLSPVGISVNNQNDLNNIILDYSIRGNNKFSFYNFELENPTLAKKIMKVTEQVATDLEIFGYGRIDYRIDQDNNFFITDIATNPHITMSMSYYYAFKKMGFTYSDVLATLFGIIMSNSRD
ncbi:hypothetical protein MX629_07220 [Carnobacterium divergens]|uniref:ATP-grasp domain-containing protein n=1 Tax=Carnobacterium divergens TaxID=2748 RepID=A0AAW8R729_CARDV|nr:hypothetical protein [Carnobacterium divergens]MDT1958218.1 hypothetical protein [Carnobacterium divergens]MDT1973485.1 hypothetical protein [Carnobacterium divergens]